MYVVLYVCAGFGCVCITYNKASLIQSQLKCSYLHLQNSFTMAVTLRNCSEKNLLFL